MVTTWENNKQVLNHFAKMIRVCCTLLPLIVRMTVCVFTGVVGADAGVVMVLLVFVGLDGKLEVVTDLAWTSADGQL